MSKLNTLLMVCFALVLASTARAQVNNAELNGDYAFSFNGITSFGGGPTPLAAVGRFTADGAGNITAGELDVNGTGPGAVAAATPFTGTYSIGADNRGVMTWNAVGNLMFLATLPFAMTASGNALFTIYDASGGNGTIGTGTIEKSDRTAYNATLITGDYAFGLAGPDNSNTRVAFAGRLTANGAGVFTNPAGDINARGNVGPATFAAASYTLADVISGRGTISMTILFAGSPFTLNFAFYTVNAGKLFVMGRDPVTGTFPLLNGVVTHQQTPLGGFSTASLNGGMVLSLTGLSVCSSGAAPASDVILGLLTANGNGGFTVTYDKNCGGVVNSFSAVPGTYGVATNGRVLITTGTGTDIAYLVSSNQVFYLGTDSSVLFGPGDAQATCTFSNSSVTGNYAGAATTPATFGVVAFSGEFAANGASPTGNITGTEDIGAPSGPNPGVAFNATYAISSSPTNGRGIVSITSPSSQSAVAYVISPSRFVILPLGDASPSVWLFE